MDVLYPRARTAFQNVSGSEYFAKIKPYLGEPGRTPGGQVAQATHMGAASFLPQRLLLVWPLVLVPRSLHVCVG